MISHHNKYKLYNNIFILSIISLLSISTILLNPLTSYNLSHSILGLSLNSNTIEQVHAESISGSYGASASLTIQDVHDNVNVARNNDASSVLA